MGLPTFRRLGISELILDHLRTFTDIDAEDESHVNWSDLFVFFVIPIGTGVTTWELHGRMRAPSQMIAGVSIITGLLFVLLVHILGLGASVATNAKITSQDGIVVRLDELRANISWAIATGLVLNAILMMVGTFRGDETAGANLGYPPWLSGMVVAFFTHLMFTLLMIFKRVRNAYKDLGK